MMDEKRRAVIECRHVSKTFYALSGDHLVVDDLNFNVYENEFVVLFGPGQCGKSTILNLISAILWRRKWYASAPASAAP